MKSTKLLSDEEVRRFIVDGYLILQTGQPREFHASVDKRLREVESHESWHGNNIAARVPALHEVIRSPSVHGALVSLLGSDYLCHPHRAVHMSTPVDDHRLHLDNADDSPPMGKGSTAGSGWHQDAQSPLSRARHHQPRFLIGFYFPHDTTLLMGPTRLQAGSHWWPHPPVKPSGVVVPQHLAAGSFILVHFDMVHAGFSNRTDMSRFMIKYVFCRMSNPKEPTWRSMNDKWQLPKSIKAELISESAARFNWCWLRGVRLSLEDSANVQALDGQDIGAMLDATYMKCPVDLLCERLRSKAGSNHHQRIFVKDENGSALLRDNIVGYPRRWNERAVVMEPETYALVAQGQDAVGGLLGLVGLSDPWLDINIAYGLGELGCCDEDVLEVLEGYLHSPWQQVVRQAVDAIGFLGANVSRLCPKLVKLMQEERPEWQAKEVTRGWRAQDQIRFNVVFAAVALLSTTTDRNALLAIFKMALLDQGYCAQVAVEGLRRIGSKEALALALSYAADRSWDDTLLGSFKAF